MRNSWVWLALLLLGCARTPAENVPARFEAPASRAPQDSPGVPEPAPGIPPPPAPTPPRAPFAVELSASRITWETTGHRGGFNTFQGMVDLVGDDPTRSSVQIDIDLASVFAYDGAFTEQLKSADFMDVSRFPKASFRSTGVTRQGDDYELTGDLTIHGTTRRIGVPASIKVDRLRVYCRSRFSLDCGHFGMAYPGRADDPDRDLVVLDLVVEAVPAP